MIMKKVGIITWHRGPNFGSALQALSLQNILCELGYDARVINFAPSTLGWKTIIRQLGKKLMMLFSYKNKLKYDFYPDRFRNRYIRQTRFVYNKSQLTKLTRDYYAIICGSDQIWAPNLLRTAYMADFANPGTRKISYAASIGLESIPVELIGVYKSNLESFHAISVREDKARELLLNNCNIDSSVVLDPTLLHGTTFYEKYESPVKGVDGGFIFCYFLNPDNKYNKPVTDYARDHNLQIVGVSKNKNDSSYMRQLEGLSAGNFLWLIKYSSMICTDSYHGTIFSLLYHKDFVTFKRFSENDPICQNSRLNQLVKYFGIENRIVDNHSNISELELYDFSLFEERIKDLRRESISFIKRSLI